MLVSALRCVRPGQPACYFQPCAAAHAACCLGAHACCVAAHVQPSVSPPLPPRQSLDVPWAEAVPAAQAAAGGGQREGASSAGALPSEQQLMDVYASLAQQGFERQHIEGTLSALPLPALSLETALDWLLLHLEAAQLPKRYAAQARAAGGSVDVRHVAQQAPSAAAEAADEQQSQQDAAAAAAAAAAAQAELEAQRAAAAERAAAEAAAAEAARAKEEEQRRAWIMQYMQESSEDESEDGSSRVDSEVRWVLACRLWLCQDSVGSLQVTGWLARLLVPCLSCCPWRKLMMIEWLCIRGVGDALLVTSLLTCNPQIFLFSHNRSQRLPPSRTGSCTPATCGKWRRPRRPRRLSGRGSSCRARTACA